jgi:hypothetical protein
MTTHSSDLMEAADVMYELSDGCVVSKVVSENLADTAGVDFGADSL